MKNNTYQYNLNNQINEQRKDWHKFDYITIDPPAWAYIWFFVVLGITQTGIWLFGFLNDIHKDEENNWIKKQR